MTPVITEGNQNGYHSKLREDHREEGEESVLKVSSSVFQQGFLASRMLACRTLSSLPLSNLLVFSIKGGGGEDY